MRRSNCLHSGERRPETRSACEAGSLVNVSYFDSRRTPKGANRLEYALWATERRFEQKPQTRNDEKGICSLQSSLRLTPHNASLR
jgi:hypothetical protein